MYWWFFPHIIYACRLETCSHRPFIKPQFLSSTYSFEYLLCLSVKAILRLTYIYLTTIQLFPLYHTYQSLPLTFLMQHRFFYPAVAINGQLLKGVLGGQFSWWHRDCLKLRVLEEYSQDDKHFGNGVRSSPSSKKRVTDLRPSLKNSALRVQICVLELGNRFLNSDVRNKGSA